MPCSTLCPGPLRQTSATGTGVTGAKCKLPELQSVTDAIPEVEVLEPKRLLRNEEIARVVRSDNGTAPPTEHVAYSRREAHEKRINEIDLQGIAKVPARLQ